MQLIVLFAKQAILEIYVIHALLVIKILTVVSVFQAIIALMEYAYHVSVMFTLAVYNAPQALLVIFAKLAITK